MDRSNKYETETSRFTEFEDLQVRVVDAISNWCEALHGSISLREAVEHLVNDLGAEAGMLVRTNLHENRSVRVAIHDARATKCRAPLAEVFADSLFGTILDKARPASAWLGSVHADDDANEINSKLSLWQEARGMKEFAVLVLAGGPNTRDHIELHFREALSPQVQNALATVLPAMARTWASRQAGLVTRTVINHRTEFGSNSRPKKNRSLLGLSNPAQLSRAEFRVCLLLSRGLSAAGAGAELGLAETTIRSHLRNIYAKTGACNLAELIFELIGSVQAPERHYAISA